VIAEAIRHLGFRVVSGSSTRGGVEAMRRMLELSKNAHVAITPDGPRGPRRRVQPGMIHLAARTGLPIVIGAFGYDRPWRMRSWDRFALPRPWSLSTCVLTPPISVPANADREQLEEYRQLVEDTFVWISTVAERWAEEGRWRNPGQPPCLTPARRVA